MKPREPDIAALLASVALHAVVVLVALSRPQPEPRSLPESVAMRGNSIEVEVPTEELATPAPASVAADAEPSPAAEPPPVDIQELPSERSPDAAPAQSTLPAAPTRPTLTQPTKPAPKPRASTPAPAQPSRASSGAAADASGAAAAGTFGQEGLAPGVRRLGYAFTRAIPAASPADSAWRELPAGHVGTIRIELSVDESNRLGELRRWQSRPGEPPPPAVLERMVERTLILLRAGQFALSGSNSPGTERLTVDVTIRDEAPDEEGADVVVQKRFDGASPGRPGTAYFRYGTGRAVEAKVTISKSGP